MTQLFRGCGQPCSTKDSFDSAVEGHARDVPSNPSVTSSDVELPEWFPALQMSVTALGETALAPSSLASVIEVLKRLETDPLVTTLLRFYEEGSERFQPWRYGDLLTLLTATSRIVRPRRYLEIGVRRGRSMAMVAAHSPGCEIYGFDLWMPNYAGMENPGPDFVRSEIAKVGHTGYIELISGDSHEMVPKFLAEHPSMFFDIITVDGDHSEQGAERDIRDVLPRLAIGGVIVFDDICHPIHPYLSSVWNRTVGSDMRFSPWRYDELGFGVAAAVRRYL